MDSSGVLVALLLIALVGYMAYAKAQRDRRTFDNLYRPPDERLLNEDTEFGVNGSLAFEGEADFTTDAFDLAAGNYKLMYWFPEGVMVKVELLSKVGSDSEILGIKSGEGELGFSVAATGRYFMTIEPDEDKAWEIEIIRLGLPSRS
ncbi:MAG: hypothetical protein LCI00_22500 [Chloroflexi bacterium]|nr:hypothetical protein [Chloroflexota bacterium]MCC6895238.1 hypothetical protein [Anaerolineae bacterium]